MGVRSIRCKSIAPNTLKYAINLDIWICQKASCPSKI
jgi:hypothetical protein